MSKSPIDVKQTLLAGPVLDASGKAVDVNDMFNCPLPEAFIESKVAADGDAKAAAEAAMGPQLDWRNERVIGLYFSAHWCPPCRGFTPKLSQIYSACEKTLGTKDAKDFKMVFCSRDSTEVEWREYAASMPFYRLPFNDPRVGRLMGAFNVLGIPSVILIRARDGTIINTSGRFALESGPAAFPWAGNGGSGMSGGVRMIIQILALIFAVWYFMM